MLPKRNRSDTKTVEQIFKSGRSVPGDNINFKFIRKEDSLPRISVIVPKSVAKLAVKRNFLRRRGYSALAKYIKKFPVGISGAIVFKKYQDNISIIENEIKKILAKIN